ncbi:unnamed protein product [Adineta steineri]|uniref:Uncharacterized protein n=1 Tax=Adineta steineri TaxID=433720 RepID=A0A819NDG5_9BILA|nr:unnamed protein product [Adineta steineri]
MATANSTVQCSVCNKENTTYLCRGCSKDYCFHHLKEHRQNLHKELDGIISDHQQFQQRINQQKQNPHNSSLIKEINQWETNAIEKILQTAQQCRETVIKLTQKPSNGIEKEFIELFKKLKEIRRENEFNEIDLKHLQLKLTQITEEFLLPTNISIQQGSQEFINKISVISSLEQGVKAKLAKWKQYGIIIGGGNGQGNQTNQLFCPEGIVIDHQNNIFIADFGNNRIVEWKSYSNNGQIIAGGNRNDQLRGPRDVIVDTTTNSLIISDSLNRRIVRWSRQNQIKQQILISDIVCFGLAIDKKNRFIYVSDWEKNEVRRWKEGDERGTIVAGGHGKGDRFNQLDHPTFIFVDKDDSLYVSDCENHRVMKWKKNAKEGIVVAGGDGKGSSLKQLSQPAGLIVDDLGRIYVVDNGNDRVMCWCEGDAEGEIVVGGHGKGEKSNQLNYPTGLTFDDEKNFYVVDWGNDRILKYEKYSD